MSDKSGKRDSNSRPLAWEANALPTELFPHFVNFGLRIVDCEFKELIRNLKSEFRNQMSLQWDSNDSSTTLIINLF